MQFFKHGIVALNFKMLKLLLLLAYPPNILFHLIVHLKQGEVIVI